MTELAGYVAGGVVVLGLVGYTFWVLWWALVMPAAIVVEAIVRWLRR